MNLSPLTLKERNGDFFFAKMTHKILPRLRKNDLDVYLLLK
jgi:hypothetical protein